MLASTSWSRLSVLAEDMTQEPTLSGLDKTVARLIQRIQGHLNSDSTPADQRILIALAGVPGSGKSTICGAVLAALKTAGIGSVAVVPQVGVLSA